MEEEEEEKKIDDDDKEEEGPAGYLCIRRAGCQQDRPRPGGRGQLAQIECNCGLFYISTLYFCVVRKR